MAHSDDPELRKWLLVAIAIVIIIISILWMVFWVDGGILVTFTLCNVVILLLGILILIGIFAQAPKCLVVSYYLDIVLIFIVLFCFIIAILFVIGTSSGSDNGKKDSNPSGITVLWLVLHTLLLELCLIGLGFLLFLHATKDLGQQIPYSPLDLLICRCCSNKSGSRR